MRRINHTEWFWTAYNVSSKNDGWGSISMKHTPTRGDRVTFTQQVSFLESQENDCRKLPNVSRAFVKALFWLLTLNLLYWGRCARAVVQAWSFCTLHTKNSWNPSHKQLRSKMKYFDEISRFT